MSSQEILGPREKACFRERVFTDQMIQINLELSRKYNCRVLVT